MENKQEVLSAAADNEYVISKDELDTIRQLIAFQYQYQPGDQPEYGQYLDLLVDLGHLTNGLINPGLKGWAVDFFTASMSHPDIAKLIITNQYRNFARRGTRINDQLAPATRPWHNMWHAFLNGWIWVDMGGDQDNHVGSAINLPGQPTIRGKLDELMNTWRSSPPFDYIDQCNDKYNQDSGYTIGTVAITSWIASNPGKLKINGTWWTKELEAVNTLQNIATLSNDQYLYLFLMLFALPTGNDEAKAIARKLCSQTGDTDDYPNDSFINHLFYLVMLHLANPQGGYRFNHEHLKWFMGNMKLVFKGAPERGSVPELLLNGLEEKLTLLNVDYSFPYAGRPGLAGRMRDERAALDEMRAAAKK